MVGTWKVAESSKKNENIFNLHQESFTSYELDHCFQIGNSSILSKKSKDSCQFYQTDFLAMADQKGNEKPANCLHLLRYYVYPNDRITTMLC